jgi:hypothetical protein
MSDEFEEHEDDPSEDEQTVDEMLNNVRPERYDLEDQEWMEPVVRKHRDHLLQQQSAEQIAEDLARKDVHTREGVATQKLNTLLRRFKDGEFPLGFGESEDWKAFYGTYLDAPLLIGRDKVRFGIATAQDLDDWVTEKKRAGEREQERRDETIDGAEWLATALREQHVDRVEDFRRPTDQ